MREIKVGERYKWREGVINEDIFFTVISAEAEYITYRYDDGEGGDIRIGLYSFLADVDLESLENKESTQAVRFNEGKLDWSQVDFKSLEPMVRGLMYGAEKYPAKNWQKSMEKNNPLNSAMRHLTALMDGEEIDAESNVSHAGLVMCNMMFYIYHFVNGKS